MAQRGPIQFSEFQELALYHPQAGFFSTRGSAGRSGDFITSPEVGGLFAKVLADALDRWWRQLGRPDPFFIVDVGASVGTLAASIIEAQPQCLKAVRYVLVERSMPLRNEQTGKLDLLPPKEVLEVDLSVFTPGRGPFVTSLASMPAGPLTGIVLANELLDNLATDIYERKNRHWYAVRVTASRDGGLEEVFVEVTDDDPVMRQLNQFAFNAPDGARLPIQHEAAAWLSNALNTIDRGKVVVIDYMRTTRWMSGHPWEEWMRTFRGHRPGGPPLESPGTQDITCEVALDQLAQVRQPDRNRSQTDFLESHGLLDLMADAREAWHARAAMGDMGAMRARARVQEGRALTDAEGLGRYRVLEWDIPMKKVKEGTTKRPIGDS